MFRPTIANGFQITIVEYLAHFAGDALVSHASYSAIVSRATAVPFAFAGIGATYKSNAIAFVRRNYRVAFDFWPWVGRSTTAAVAIFF